MIDKLKEKWEASKHEEKKALFIIGYIVLLCFLVKFGINIGSAIGKL
ncbi:hypothetical protein [Veronia nyctiphanis]|nr:hypothetical protein [Veronia nyctiphanis]